VAAALREVGPSGGREAGFEGQKPDVRWEDVGGYEQVKSRLIRLSTWPLEHPEAYNRLGVKPPSGILLYGPSGCGKTMLVHALVSGSSMNFISVKGHEIFSKYLGESEASVRRLFAAARRLAPCLLFLDEVDTVGTRREWTDDGATGVNERVLSTLLNEMDGVQERTGVLVVACTNRPDKIDDALLRPGRLDHHIYVPLPTYLDRRAIVEALARDRPDGRAGARLDPDVDPGRVAGRTEGFTGADLAVLAR
ncbi:P-loop containing nucleoside triphosphate hydrolase protein, partial [Blyttiomyces helicus]